MDCSVWGTDRGITQQVAVTKNSDETMRHLPRNIPRLCSMFIEQGGDIAYVVKGKQWQQFNSDNVLLQQI